MDSNVATAISSLSSTLLTSGVPTYAAILVAILPTALALWALRTGWHKMARMFGLRV